MHYGLQAIVLALNAMEVSTDNESSSDNDTNGTAIYLQQLREHLDAITSPVRRVLKHLFSIFSTLVAFTALGCSWDKILGLGAACRIDVNVLGN